MQTYYSLFLIANLILQLKHINKMCHGNFRCLSLLLKSGLGQQNFRNYTFLEICLLTRGSEKKKICGSDRKHNKTQPKQLFQLWK